MADYHYTMAGVALYPDGKAWKARYGERVEFIGRSGLADGPTIPPTLMRAWDNFSGNGNRGAFHFWPSKKAVTLADENLAIADG